MNNLSRRGASRPTSTSVVLRAAICGLTIVSTTFAQTFAVAPSLPASAAQETASNAAASPLPASQGMATPMPKDAGGAVKFNVPKVPAKVGAPYAFNLCTGTEVPLPKGTFTSAMGEALDTKQGPCVNRPGGTVAGGNPPYHFQLDTMGGFPPIGMHLGLNGLLYGTPIAKPPMGGFPAFNVCAVDLNGSQDCHPASFGPAPAAAPQQAAKAGGGHGGAILLLGGIVVLGVAGAAYEVEKNKTSCGAAPQNPLDVCSIPNNTANCNSDLSAYGTWCKCNGYAGGFNAGQGSCVN